MYQFIIFDLKFNVKAINIMYSTISNISMLCFSVGNQIVVRGYAADMWKQVQWHNPMEESVTRIFNKVPRALAVMWSGTGIKGTDRHCATGDSIQLH